MDERTRVVITGIDIPFGDLITLLVKLAFAAIPAGIVLTFAAMGITALLMVAGILAK